MTVVGSDARDATPHAISDFKILVRLQPGSNGLNLNNTILTLDTEDATASLTYNQTIASDAFSATTIEYVVYYVLRGNNYQEGYINAGDNVKIIFKVSPEIGENELIRLKLIPRIGSYTQIEFTTPDSMNQRSMTLWPS